MKLGDTISIADVEWTVRPFTAEEHEAFELLSDGYQLRELAAQLQAMKGARTGTMREKLIRKEISRREASLEKFLDEQKDLKEDLSEEENLEAFKLAAELDMYVEQLETVRTERTAVLLSVENQVLEAQEQVSARFMYQILEPETPIEEYLLNLTDEDRARIDEVVALGKLPVGLSAWTRRQAISWDQILELYQRQQNGKDSESPPPQPAARKKRGPSGRSKKSSSKSRAGV